MSFKRAVLDKYPDAFPRRRPTTAGRPAWRVESPGSGDTYFGLGFSLPEAWRTAAWSTRDAGRYEVDPAL
jgi:hypothetical protein